MRKDLTDITVVLDRSGSMSICQQEAENGLNHFIKEQQELSGECRFTLVQFDTEYEFVHNGVPITEVPKYTLVPRGMTALLDAVGRAINEVGIRLAATPEQDRPELVVFAIITDGQENSSSEFNRSQIRKMIERQQNEYNWKIIFLGANQDSFAEAGSLGIAAAATANYDVDSSDSAFMAASSAVSRSRKAVMEDACLDLSFTDDERDSMVNTQQR